jgi:hypothetical protein
MANDSLVPDDIDWGDSAETKPEEPPTKVIFPDSTTTGTEDKPLVPDDIDWGTPTTPPTPPESAAAPEDTPLVPDDIDWGEGPRETNVVSQKGNKFILTLSDATKSKIEDARKEESKLSTPGGGLISRGIALGGEAVGLFDKQDTTLEGVDDWYSPDLGVANLYGLLQSGLPQDKKYGILMDIAKDIYQIPEEQFKKVLPESMYGQKADGALTDIIKTGIRAAQQATPFGEDIARMAIRKIRDFPFPPQWASDDTKKAIKDAMRKGGGEIVLDGKKVTIPAKAGTEGEVNEFLQDEWEGHVKEVSELLGDSLGTFTEGLISEGLQVAVPLVSGALSATGVAAPAAAPIGAASVARTARRAVKTYEALINPTERLAKTILPKLSTKAAAVMASSPLATTVVSNAIENFAINTQESMKERAKRAAIGAAIPLVPAGIKAGAMQAIHAGKVPDSVKELQRIKSGEESVVRLSELLGKKKVAEIVSGDTPAPKLEGLTSDQVKEMLGYIETTKREPLAVKQQIASAEVMRIVRESGEDSEVVKHLDNFYTMSRGHDLKTDAAVEAYKLTIRQSNEDVAKVLRDDDYLHTELLVRPEANPVAIMAERHPHVAKVFEDFYNTEKSTRRRDALIAVARVSASPTHLEQLRQAALDDKADVYPEHSKNRMLAYNQIIEDVMPAIDKVRKTYNEKQIKAFNLRQEIIGEVDGILGGLKGADKMKQEWIKARELVKNNPYVDFRTLPEFKIARKLADRVAASKLRSKTKMMEGQFVKDRLSSLSSNMQRYDNLLLDMDADMQTIRNVLRKDILNGRTAAFDLSAEAAGRPSREQRVIDQLTNPKYTRAEVKEITRKMLTDLAVSKKFKDSDFNARLDAAMELFSQDIRDSEGAVVVNSIAPLRELLEEARDVLEPEGRPHPNLSGLKQIVTVAKAMDDDNATAQRMQEYLHGLPPNKVVAILPTLGAMADSMSTMAGLTKAAGILATAKFDFNQHMQSISRELGLDSPARFDHVFDILAGDLRTRIRLKKDPEIPIAVDKSLLQMIEAADILSAKAIKEIMVEFKKTLDMDLDVEVFLSQFVTQDNFYGANALFQSKLADIKRYSAALDEWKKAKASMAGGMGKVRLLTANTEMMNQIIMKYAPAMDGVEIEQYAGGIKRARAELSKYFSYELKTIESKALGEWGDKRVSSAANLILGLDGMDKVGFFFRNSLSEGFKLEPAGLLLKNMYADASIARISKDAISDTDQYISKLSKLSDIRDTTQRRAYHSRISTWQKAVMSRMMDTEGSVDKDVVRLILDTDDNGIPPILRYISKQNVFDSEKYSDPAVWQNAWDMVKFDADSRRYLYGVQNSIYKEERELYQHLGLQLHNHSWFERYVAQRTTREAMTDYSPDRLFDRLYNRADQTARFSTTEAGQLAKTSGLSLRDADNIVANPLLTLLDDIVIGTMGARTSHSKEFLRQRGILLQNLGWVAPSEWIKLYYQQDLRIADVGETMEKFKRNIMRIGQREGTPTAIRSARIAAPTVGLALGWHLPFVALTRPWSTLFRQPMQQATTAILTSGARNIKGESVNPLTVYAGFWGRTIGRMFTKAEDLAKHMPSNYRDGMRYTLKQFTDASDTKRLNDLKLLLHGESEGVDSLVRSAYTARKVSSAFVDHLNRVSKENSETSMTSIQIEIGANIHRRMMETAIEMRDAGVPEGEIRKKLLGDLTGTFRTKTAAELWDQISRVTKDALSPEGREMLSGGPMIPSLVPFLTFFTTNSVTRFGTLSNPVAVNTFRVLMPNDLRFFAARFNNFYLGLGAVMPALRMLKRNSLDTSYLRLSKIEAMQKAWESRFVGVPEQLNGSLGLFMTGASLMAVGALLDGGLDIPFYDEKGYIQDEDKNRMARRMMSYVVEPTPFVRELGELAKPISLYGERARGWAMTGSNVIDTMLPPEMISAIRGIQRLAEASEVLGDSPEAGIKFSLIPYRVGGLESAYVKAYNDWLDAKDSGDNKRITESYSRMYRAYDQYAFKKGGALLNYALTQVAGLNYVYRALPWDIIRYSHLAEAEGRMFSGPMAKTEAVNSPKYYAPWREILDALGVAENAPYSTKLGEVAKFIYKNLKDNGHLTEEQYEYYTGYMAGFLKTLDEEDFSLFAGMTAGFIPEKKADTEARERMIKRKVLTGEIPEELVRETPPAGDYEVQDRFSEAIMRKVGKSPK